MVNPLISVIVPIYKVEQYLDECIVSIVNQTYTNLEILLVDDGSPDRSPEICDQWKEKDNRIQVIHKVNGGLADARNAGLDVMHGEYVLFVDSDDYLHPEMVQKLYDGIKSTSADICMCKADKINKTEQMYYIPDLKEPYTLEGKAIMKSFLYYRNNMNTGVWNKLFSAKLFSEVRFVKGTIMEDYMLYGSLYLQTKKVHVIPDALYYYRMRVGSISHMKPKKGSYFRIDISDRIAELLKQANYTDKKAMKHFQMLARYIIVNDLIRYNASKQDILDVVKELRQYSKGIWSNPEVSRSFKGKLAFLLLLPHVYIKTKKSTVQSAQEDFQNYFE